VIAAASLGETSRVSGIMCGKVSGRLDAGDSFEAGESFANVEVDDAAEPLCWSTFRPHASRKRQTSNGRTLGRPNGVRLRCGATVSFSQRNSTLEDARRQLQARVRPLTAGRPAAATRGPRAYPLLRANRRTDASAASPPRTAGPRDPRCRTQRRTERRRRALH